MQSEGRFPMSWRIDTPRGAVTRLLATSDNEHYGAHGVPPRAPDTHTAGLPWPAAAVMRCRGFVEGRGAGSGSPWPGRGGSCLGLPAVLAGGDPPCSRVSMRAWVTSRRSMAA